MVRGALAGAALVALAALGWGGQAVGGVAVGAAVALLNFAWLARGAALVSGSPGGRTTAARRAVALALRHAATLAALGGPAALGWAHPVALGVGVTVLPLALVVQGLRTARQED